MRSFLAGITWVLCATSAFATMTVPPLFGDHMVLQREKANPIWGTAEPKEPLKISLNGQTVSTVADEHGHWKAQLPSLPAGGPYTLSVEGSSKVDFQDVMIGEVWICSGQSNMEISIQTALNGGKEIAAAKYPNLRLFTVKRASSDHQLDTFQGAWSPCTPESVKSFSATAYFFGRDLQQALNVPVGVVVSAWSGASIENWLSSEAFAKDPDAAAMQAAWQKGVDDFPNAKAAYDALVADFPQATEKAKAENKPLPRLPHTPLAGDGQTPEEAPFLFDQKVQHYAIQHPSCLFNGMIAPIIPYGMRGVLWYQGESNLFRAEQYRRLFPLLITDWRSRWGQGDFPFLYVQLPNIGKPSTDPMPPQNNYPELREAQALALSLPATFMTVNYDLGTGDIHPNNKPAIGHRLAIAAQAAIYGAQIASRGPVFKSLKTEGAQLRLTFDDDPLGGGLAVQRGNELKGFAVAGADGKYAWAEARIDGDAVLLSSTQVAEPKTVRYAWENFPEATLGNKAGLPAAPFRTDTLPLQTAGQKVDK